MRVDQTTENYTRNRSTKGVLILQTLLLIVGLAAVSFYLGITKIAYVCLFVCRTSIATNAWIDFSKISHTCSLAHNLNRARFGY